MIRHKLYGQGRRDIVIVDKMLEMHYTWGKQQFKRLGIELDVDIDKIFGLNLKQRYDQ